MSIVTDLRARAEGALGQALDSAPKTLNDVVVEASALVEQLQERATVFADKLHANLTGATEKATSTASKASSRDVNLGGKSVSLDGLIADIEDLVKRYRETASERTDAFVTDIKNDERLTKLVERAEALVGEVKSDQRVTALLERAETVYAALYEALQERVIKPAQDLITKTPAETKSEPKKTAPKAPKAASEPALTKATKAPAAKKSPAAKATKTTPAKKVPPTQA